MSTTCQTITIQRIAHTHVAADITDLDSVINSRYVNISGDVMTGPLSAIYGLLKHPLTDIGLAQFIADFEKGNK